MMSSCVDTAAVLPVQSPSPCLLCVQSAVRLWRLSLSEEVESHEKCPPAGYMKVWNCRLLFALGLMPQKVFLLLLTVRLNRGLMAAAAEPTSPSILDCFCFQVTSYLLLQLFQFLRARCMKTEGARWEMHINLRRAPTQRKHFKSSHFHAQRRRWARRLHQSNNQINAVVH